MTLVPQTMPTKRLALLYILRICFGLTFIFSGFVKCIDPLGTAYKIQDYATAMNISLADWLALTGSIVMSALEFLVGITILLGVRPKESTFVGILFMCVMTPLTFWIALANPVTDCGCFGDALVIDNWTTFWKNIVLTIIIISIWILQRDYRPWVSGLTSWLMVATLFLIPVLLSTVSLKRLPMLDFRPYHIGSNIIAGMELPEGAEPDKYETWFIYEQNGLEKKFQLMDAPYNDSTWRFVTQQTTLVKKGASPAIHDFSIITLEGDDITYDILENSGKTYFIVMYDLNKADTSNLNIISKLVEQAKLEDADIMILTASSDDEIKVFEEKNSLNLPYNFTDPITLKTMIRANPGVRVIQEATVLDKWNLRNHKKRLIGNN